MIEWALIWVCDTTSTSVLPLGLCVLQAQSMLQRYDLDASGLIDSWELCAAMLDILPSINAQEMHLVLAYAQQAAASSSGKHSLLQLQEMVRPFLGCIGAKMGC